MTNSNTPITALNEMVLQGNLLEAFDKFYADEVIMQENELPPTVGKDLNRKREEDFLNSLIDFRSAQVLEVTYGENVTMVLWAYDYTHKEWGTKKYTQVSVQHWRNGQIIKEQYFYNN